MRPFTIFKTPWEKRVFVGGSMGLSSVIEQIRDVVNKAGYDAIVAIDFDIPEGMTTYHECLLLLHCCKYAIFDVSEHAGQLLEVDRVAEYGVTTLAVWPVNRDKAITEMLKSSLDIRGIKHKTYRTFDEMSVIISEFLKRERLPSKEKVAKHAFSAEKELIKLSADKEKVSGDVSFFMFFLEKEAIKLAVSTYYFDIHKGGHYFPVGDSPGLSADILAARGGGDINLKLLVGSYLNEEPLSSYSLGGSYVWHIDSAGIVDTTYKGVFP